MIWNIASRLYVATSLRKWLESSLWRQSMPQRIPLPALDLNWTFGLSLDAVSLDEGLGNFCTGCGISPGLRAQSEPLGPVVNVSHIRWTVL